MASPQRANIFDGWPQTVLTFLQLTVGNMKDIYYQSNLFTEFHLSNFCLIYLV